MHKKAMPAILMIQEIETGLTATWEEANSLQRPLPDDALVRVG
ncbi:hypothetical protein [Rhizobium sp. CFBP 8752]